MDASASKKVDSDNNNVFGLFLQIDDPVPNSIKKNTVIKYTKLPDFDFDSIASWPQNSYVLQPRLRRIITLGEIDDITTHSYNPEVPCSPKVMTTNVTRRKIATISEDEEVEHSKTSSKEIRSVAKLSNTRVMPEPNISKSNPKNKSNQLTISHTTAVEKLRNTKEKVNSLNNKNVKSAKTSISKNPSPSISEREVNLLKNKLTENARTARRTPVNKTQPSLNKRVTNKPVEKNPVTVIHVPIDKDYHKNTNKQTKPESKISKVTTVDCSTEIDKVIAKEMSVGTKPMAATIDRETDMSEPIDLITEKHKLRAQLNQEKFDSLQIPNVTLIKDRSEREVDLYSKSLPNLDIPKLKIATPDKMERSHDYCKSTAYIIGRATVTYTTRQKINFHVVDSSDDSTLSPSPLMYPVNVMSVFKNEINQKNYNKPKEKKKHKKLTHKTNTLSELKSVNCSYVFNSNKLVKPSDIISTISVNSGLLQSDYICEQFQSELNFIDSFFESLQYLERCSVEDKCLTEDKVESWINPDFDEKNNEYSTFLSKIENGADIDDTETMASKSLCLLNLLIRDEQRRAKNLLFVLKMREDALKDFTKSQILYLENKKKQDNTDISTLKKKQRGALLKLQHECGEMQRMRKALLTLSEKRKLALMKTKKNIELKLHNSVDVDKILLNKKKLKRSSVDRNIAPLKCFDLSSSCDDTTPPTCQKSDNSPTPEATVPTQSVEKSIQTGDSILSPPEQTDTAAENFVVVDGTYLNILFHNLHLPQIFSSGKQYEVNEEALKNIVHSANSHSFSDNNVIEKFIDDVKKCDLDRSSSPSTARSLVEELDQYYKDLVDDDKSSSDHEYRNDRKDEYIILEEQPSHNSASTMTSDSVETILSKTNIALVDQSCNCDVDRISVETQVVKGKESVSMSNQAGPLPVPAGCDMPEIPAWQPPKLPINSPAESCDSSPEPSVSPISISSSVHCEAEELRRQQLAIEREIKALEQEQQCQLLVVREIPDKPPPPYTPPSDARIAKPPRKFAKDETTEEKIQKYFDNELQPTETFDVFIKDFCGESVTRNKCVNSDMPWDSVNLLPQKSPLNYDKLVKKTSTELSEVLGGVKPTVVSGVSTRRSDHIDDILFAEWRRCEPEWTSLHVDEAVVKNQIFESIFQKILTDTIDQYKKTVLSDN